MARRTRQRHSTAAPRRPAGHVPGAVESLERRQLLSAALTVSSSLMVYNAVKNNTSQVETLTLTDTGDGPLTLGPTAFAETGTAAGRFTLTDAGSAPAQLAVGASFGLTLTYRPTAVGRDLASLLIATADATTGTALASQAVSLSGIGAAGLGGSNQPSLARILRAYNIPTIVGEGPNDSAEASDSIYPNPPDASSQEVPLQRLVKAGAGPVSINVLASFTASGAEPYTLGYYTAGTPTAKTELFYTPAGESQSTYVQPQGSTSFDPGSGAFGMYFVTPSRTGYSEDAYNTYDTTVPRKFRFFPMETPAGVVVPNTYVMTSTEYYQPVGYDFTNLVAVISNVTAAPGVTAGAPLLSVTDPSALPGSSNVIFSNIRFPNSTIGDVVHNADTLTLTNTGQAPLVVSGLTLTNTAAWSVSAGPALPATVAPGASTTVTLAYNDRSTPSSTYDQTSDPNNPGGGGFETGTLTIASNDPTNGSRVLKLAGYTQFHSENANEPSLQTITNLLAGYGTLVSGSPVSELTETLTAGGTPTYYGEETVSAYWTSADPGRAVTAIQLAAFHTEGDTDTFGYFKQGSTSVSTILNQAKDDGQTVLPLNSAGALATGSFTTTSTFGFKVSGSAGNVWSDDTLNSQATAGGHDFRFYPVRDAIGSLVPNTYIVAMDYPSSTQNFDFQDNVWIVSNIRPAAAPGAAPAAPTDLSAVNTAGGVSLTWAPSLTAGVTGYNVYRQVPNGSFAKVNTSPVTAPAYLDATASTTAPQNYRVTAYAAAASTTSTATPPVTTTTPAMESVGSSVLSTTAAAVPVAGSASISGTVFDDSNWNGVYDAGEPGLANQIVFIDVAGTGSYVAGVDSVASTDANGHWTIGGLNPGTYKLIQTTPAGFNRTLPGSSSYMVTVGSNGVATNVNFGADRLGVINGHMFLDYNGNAQIDYDEPGLQGFSMFIDNNRNGIYDPGIDTQFTSDNTGFYSTTNLPPGTYELGQVLPAGFGRSTPGLPTIVTVNEGAVTLVNFGITRGTIYGTVYNDANGNGTLDAGEAGLANVGIYLDYHGTGVYQSDDYLTHTDANGNYRIGGMAPGTYTVNVIPPSGYAVTSPTAGYTASFYPGQIRLGDNFGLIATATPASQVAPMVATPAAQMAAVPPAPTGDDRLADAVDALLG